MHDRILILDFGSQVTQLIARRVREAHVFCEIHPNDVSDAFIREFAPRGIILSGSHASTYEEHELRAPRGGVRSRRAGARHLLRHVHDGGAARRPGRGEHAPRVRLCGGASARPHQAARRPGGLLDDRGPRHAQGLDEPRRQGHRAAARLRPDGLDRRAARSPAWPTSAAASTRCSSIPRSRTPSRAASCSSASSSGSAARSPTG